MYSGDLALKKLGERLIIPIPSLLEALLQYAVCFGTLCMQTDNLETTQTKALGKGRGLLHG